MFSIASRVHVTDDTLSSDGVNNSGNGVSVGVNIKGGGIPNLGRSLSRSNSGRFEEPLSPKQIRPTSTPTRSPHLQPSQAQGQHIDSSNIMTTPYRRQPISIGKLVSLDLTGAPRIDDDAMMVLFGGGSYQKQVNDLPDYLVNKASSTSTSSSDSLSRINSPLQHGGVGNGMSSSSSPPFFRLDSFNEEFNSNLSPKRKSQYNSGNNSGNGNSHGYGYGGGSMALRHLKIKWCNSLSDSGMATALQLASKNSEKGLLLETFDAQGLALLFILFIYLYVYALCFSMPYCL